ncbi:hypothetical protein D3C81_1956980 [compost metagenome]
MDMENFCRSSEVIFLVGRRGQGIHRVDETEVHGRGRRIALLVTEARDTGELDCGNRDHFSVLNLGKRNKDPLSSLPHSVDWTVLATWLT